MNKITFIIPCWQNPDLSVKAIDSALEVQDSRIIIVDNDNSDNFKGYQSNKQVTLIKPEKNLGWVGGINLGLEHIGDCQYVCFMNNDVELPVDFMEKIEPHFGDDVGAVGPVGNNVAGLHDTTLKGYPDHHEVKVLIGYCMVIKKEVVDMIGGLDPIFGWGLSDDLDYSLRTAKIGYRLFIARDCQVFHHGSMAVKKKYKTQEEYDADLKQKNKIFIEKWGQKEYDDIVRIEPHIPGTIGVPHLEMVHAGFMNSFMNMARPQGTIANCVNGTIISKSRNMIAKEMKGDWLLFVDSDMHIPQDALNKLLAHDVDIVGGLCFRRVPPYNPTIYMKRPGEDKWEFQTEYPRDSLFEVDATGSAFILIKKKVFDKIAYPWYEYNQDVSEDLIFCKKAKEAGFKIYIDSSVKIGHLGMMPVDEPFFDNYMKNKKVVKA